MGGKSTSSFLVRTALTENYRRKLTKVAITPQTDDWQKTWIKETRNLTDEVKIDPETLFNYRLSCAINRELAEEELADFQSLYDGHHQRLHHRSEDIDHDAARVAAGRYPIIQSVLSDVGVDLGVVGRWTRPTAPPFVAHGVPQAFQIRHENLESMGVRDEKVVTDQYRVPRPQPQPVAGYDRYGQPLYTDNSSRREGNDDWNPAGEGLSQPPSSRIQKPEHHGEHDLVKSFKGLLHRHHDK